MRTEVVRKAPHADMFSPARDMLPEERAILDRELDGVYADFVEIVAEGRKRDRAEIEKLAKGRVWSGRDAFEQGLVDRLGGMSTAIDEVQKRAGEGDLPVRLLIPRRTDLPPAEPRAAAAEAALHLIRQVAPSAAAAIELSGGHDRVLMLAPGVPEIR